MRGLKEQCGGAHFLLPQKGECQQMLKPVISMCMLVDGLGRDLAVVGDGCSMSRGLLGSWGSNVALRDSGSILLIEP